MAHNQAASEVRVRENAAAKRIDPTGTIAASARVAVLLLAVVGVVATPSSAGAGVSTFSMSPTSGPPGTSVSVSGTGCAPGLLLSPSQDFVAIAFTTVPPVSKQIAVATNGTWSGTVSIPANATAAPAAVTALCFSDGLGSLLTLYVPKTFTVTQVASPTTAAPAPATTSPLPPPTRLIGGAPPTTIVAPTTTLGTTPDPTGGHPTTTTRPRTTPPPKRQNQPPGAGGGGGNGGGFAAAPTTTAIGRGNGSAPGSAPTDPTLGSAPVGAHVHGRQAGDQQYPTRAADLSDPKLAGSLAAGHSTGLGWLDWLLLILAGIALAAFARWMLWWRRREGQVVATPTAT